MMEEIQTGINDIQYWNGRFQEDWEEKGGREQSVFFSAVAFENLPIWIKQYVVNDQPSFCDWGCALGDGTDYLRRALMLNKIYGIDFSTTAIEKARERYPEIIFFDTDITIDRFNKKFNIIFSSNTLEHFYHPWKTLKKAASYADQHLIVMIPFKEYQVCSFEHFSTFDFHSIPQTLNEEFSLTHSQVIDTSKKENTSWAGLQVLLIYSHRNFLAKKNLSLEELTIETAVDYKVKLESQQQQTETGAAISELQILTGQYTRLLSMLQEKDIVINSYQKLNEEISARLFNTEQGALNEKKKYAEAEILIQTITRQAEILKEEKDSYQKNISTLSGELRRSEEQIRMLETTVTDLQNILEARLNEIEEQKNNVQTERLKRIEITTQLESRDQQIRIFDTENKEIKEQLGELKELNTALTKQNADKEQIINDFCEKMNRLEIDYHALNYQHQLFLKSSSWRFTKPFRLFVHSLKARFGKN